VNLNTTWTISLQEEEGITPEEVKESAENIFCKSEILLAAPLKDRGTREW
jgi:hypothetical protein